MKNKTINKELLINLKTPKEIKLVVLDLDGTMLRNFWKIHPKNLLAVQEMYKKRKNVNLLLATGRPVFSTLKFVKQCQNKVDPKKETFFVCQNGALIMSMNIKGETKIIKETFFKNEELKTLIACLKLFKGLAIWIYGENKDIFINRLTFRMFFLEMTNLVFAKKINKIDLKKKHYKVLFFCKNKQQADKLTDYLIKNYDLNVFLIEYNVVEVDPKNVNKINAIKYLAKELNITNQETLACGDAANDEEMIKWAKYGIAMKNATPLLKEAAKYITEKNNKKGGVAEVLNKFLELKIDF